MAVTVKSTTSYGSRLGGAIKGIFTGILLILLGIGLLWWNEGRTVKRYKALKEGAQNVISISADTVDPQNEGKLVHLSAKAITQETLRDAEFGIELPGALRLIREVQMYQYQETSETTEEEKIGGSVETTTTYDYEKIWSSNPIDSKDFQEPGHENPTLWLIKSRESLPKTVKVGAFRLSDTQIQALGQEKTLEFATDYQVPQMPAELLAFYNTPTTRNNEIYFSVKKQDDTGNEATKAAENAEAAENAKATEAIKATENAEATAPQIGDLRVTFRLVESHDISLVYVQKGDSFAPYQAKTGTVALQFDGIHTADQMFASAQSTNSMIAWALRLLGFFLIFVGFQAIFRPIQVLASVLPFLGRMVGTGTGIISFLLALPITLIVIAVAWLFYRPVLAVILLLATIAAIVALKKAYAGLKSKANEPPATE
jgi:hypothetical protein